MATYMRRDHKGLEWLLQKECENLTNGPVELSSGVQLELDYQLCG